MKENEMKNYYLDRANEKEEKSNENIVYIIGVDMGIDFKNLNWAYSGGDWELDVTTTDSSSLNVSSIVFCQYSNQNQNT